MAGDFAKNEGFDLGLNALMGAATNFKGVKNLFGRKALNADQYRYYWNNLDSNLDKRMKELMDLPEFKKLSQGEQAAYLAQISSCFGRQEIFLVKCHGKSGCPGGIVGTGGTEKSRTNAQPQAGGIKMEETIILENSMESAAESEPMEETAQSGQAEEIQGDSARKPEQETGEAYQPLTVKYNGSQRQLSREEAVAYAQKGMNYDKIHDRLKAYEDNSAMKRAYSLLEDLSARHGISPEEYLDGIDRQRQQDEISRIAEKDGLTADQAREIHRARQENDRLSEENRFNREFQELLRENPDLRSGDIPSEAIYYRSRYGMPLKEAYRLTAGYEKLAAEKAELERKLSIREEGRANSGMSTGSARGRAEARPRTEHVGRMSLAEYEKYRDAIWAELERGSKRR